MRRAHRAKMLRRRAAAAADDPRAGIDRKPRIVGHQLRRAGIVDVLAEELRNAAIRFRDEGEARARLGHLHQRIEEVGGADAAIRAHRERLLLEDRRRPPEDRPAAGPSSCARPCRSSRSRCRACRRDRAFRRRAHFLGGRHRLDPADVGAAGLQPSRLLGEGGDRIRFGHRAERHEELAGRADRAGDDDRPPGRIGDRRARAPRPPC